MYYVVCSNIGDDQSWGSYFRKVTSYKLLATFIPYVT